MLYSTNSMRKFKTNLASRRNRRKLSMGKSFKDTLYTLTEPHKDRLRWHRPARMKALSNIHYVEIDIHLSFYARRNLRKRKLSSMVVIAR